MNYYEHHLGDHAKTASHLSMLEDGAYLRLRDAYYTREASLPLDVQACCKLARATSKAERTAVRYVLAEFFEQRDDGYHCDRFDAEIDKYRELQSAENEKRAHDAERQRRHRIRRAKLFDALRDLDVVPKFDTPTGDLERLLAREKAAKRNASVTRDDSVTSRTGNASLTDHHTATHYPLPNNAVGNTPQERESSSAHATATGGDTKADLARDAAAANPVLPWVVELRKRGGLWLRVTAENPDLHAAHAEGVALESIMGMADAYPEKPPLYAIRAARYARAEKALPISAPGAETPRQSKTKEAFDALDRVVETLESAELDRARNQRGVQADADAVPRKFAGA